MQRTWGLVSTEVRAGQLVGAAAARVSTHSAEVRTPLASTPYRVMPVEVISKPKFRVLLPPSRVRTLLMPS